VPNSPLSKNVSPHSGQNFGTLSVTSTSALQELQISKTLSDGGGAFSAQLEQNFPVFFEYCFY